MRNNNIGALTYGQIIPNTIINTELEGVYGSAVLAEQNQLIKYYDTYQNGATYVTPNTDGTELSFKKIKTLIDKQARFLFAKMPDFVVEANVDGATEKHDELRKNLSSQYQEYVNKIIKENKIGRKLLQAAKDAFIARRVAYIINVNDDGRISIDFLSALEFIYDVDPQDENRIIKLVVFYTVHDGKTKEEKRIYKKKYWIGEDGFCYVHEAEYDGGGKELTTITEETKTEFEYIPGGVIVNDGLSGDLFGESEVQYLEDYEKQYTKLSNADIDAERKSMNPIRYTIDMQTETTKGLRANAGAIWHFRSNDMSANDNRSGKVGALESSMTYADALEKTLNRVNNTMYDQIDIPYINMETMKGVVTSGKALKALYWPLTVRCDEKMLAWRPELENIVKCVIDAIYKYSAVKTHYEVKEFPKQEQQYTIMVDNQYPLPGDEIEEKGVDLSEVNSKTMSKKAYMMKWRGLTSNEADNELTQIIRENELDNSFSVTDSDLFGSDEYEFNSDTKQKQTLSGEGADTSKAVHQVEEEVGKALNGAQTQSLITVITQYSSGIITIGQAANIVSASLGVTKQKAQELIEGVI